MISCINVVSPRLRFNMASACALAILSGKFIFYFAFVAACRPLQTHFHERGRNWKAASYQAGGSGVSLRTVRWGGTLLPKAIGRAMEWPDSCPRRKLPERAPYFLILCKCFMPSSKRSRKASTSSGVLSAQKDTRMAVSMASGSRPIAASVWLGCPLPQALADET